MKNSTLKCEHAKSEQTNKIEETIWTALRIFEEHKNLLTEMARGKKVPVRKQPLKGKKEQF